MWLRVSEDLAADYYLCTYTRDSAPNYRQVHELYWDGDNWFWSGDGTEDDFAYDVNVIRYMRLPKKYEGEE